MSSIVRGISVLALLFVVNSTFNHKYDYSRPTPQETSGQVAISDSDPENLNGNLISLHNNGSIIPALIVSGKWEISESASNSTNTTCRKIKFHANVTITSIAGMNIHRDKLTDVKPSNTSLQEGSVIMNRMVSFTTSDSDIRIAEENKKLILVSIKIMNLRTISINMNNKIFM